MKKNLLIYLSLFFLSCVHSDPIIPRIFNYKPLNLKSLPLIDAFATSSGDVPLYRDELGFYANVDIASHSSDASDEVPSPDTISVMLGFYTSDTFLSNGCLEFSNYTCIYPRCNPFNWTNTSLVLPYFTVEGYVASALVYLDYSNWSLQNFATIATSCSTNANHLLGTSRTGLVGMGTMTSVTSNYLDNTVFSIYIDKGLWSGHLLFEIDLTKVQPNTVGTVLDCDGDWVIFGAGSFLQIGSNQYPIDVSVIFDLNFDTMGFPQDIYNQIIADLNSTMQCSNDLIHPICVYNGSIQNLPNITLLVQNQPILIPPMIYVKNASNETGTVSSVTLNLRAISSNLTGDSYVTIQYSNTIILDFNFISYYYTAFNTSDDGSQVVILYIAGPEPVNSSDSDTWIYIVGGCIGLVLFTVIGCCFLFYVRRKKREAQVKLLSSNNNQKNEEYAHISL